MELAKRIAILVDSTFFGHGRIKSPESVLGFPRQQRSGHPPPL